VYRNLAQDQSQNVSVTKAGCQELKALSWYIKLPRLDLIFICFGRETLYLPYASQFLNIQYIAVEATGYTSISSNRSYREKRRNHIETYIPEQYAIDTQTI
jgi:hypothetical protein